MRREYVGVAVATRYLRRVAAGLRKEMAGRREIRCPSHGMKTSTGKNVRGTTKKKVNPGDGVDWVAG